MRFPRLLPLPLLLLLAAFVFRAEPVTVYLAGDSTMAQKLVTKRPETGWGEALQQYFDVDQVRVENHARNGRSTRTFIEEGRWQTLVGKLREGDYVFVQFGHNDASKDKADRYTPPADYRRNLARFVADVRAKKANPVLFTPVRRRKFDGAGKLVDTHGEYPDLVRSVAAELRVPLVDMHASSAEVLSGFGAEESKKLFLQLRPGEHANYPAGVDDNTHFSPLGAEVMAAAAVQGIRGAQLPLARFLKDVPQPAPQPASAQQAPRQNDALLSPARIAALPAAERQAWERYLEASRRSAARDREVMAADLRAAGLEKAPPAPRANGFTLTSAMTPEWFKTDEAKRIADAIVSFQTPTGGWSKRVELTRPRRPGESWASEGNWSWVGTFDNSATTEQMRFLSRAHAARRDARYRAAYLKGLEYVFQAQFPSGCWPQVYPLVGSYHDAATFNDDAIVNVLRVLQEATGAEAALVPEATKARARASMQRGVDCIVRAQVVVDGRPTVWGQQHDPLTLAPVKARAYEHASLAGRESAGIVNFLMTLEPVEPPAATAVRAAVQWFRDTALYGYEYEVKGGLTAKPGAGPLWARFYEIGTNRPLFSNRDGVVRYRFDELEEERRAGYAWYTDEPATTLRRYERWSRRAAPAAAAPASGVRISVAVDPAHTGDEGALTGGVKTYRTIARAVADAPPSGTAPYVVTVRNGRYYEKVSVDRPNVHLVGEGRDGTVLTFDAAAGKRSPGGWTYGTRGSWTLRVAAPDFRLEGMTVENGFDYPANAAKPATDTTRIDGAQAVAVMLDEGSDRAVFRDCRISGYQDTLFPNAGRSHFRRCEILGHVDFIFGAGTAVFEDSDIVSRDRGSRTNNGYVTAPSTPLSQPYGFVFLDSRLRKERPSMAPNSVSLGRPWHPSGRPDAVGSAVFIRTWMDDHVGEKGWDVMNSTDAAGYRVVNRPEDARFFEHGTTGPGAVRSPSRRVLTEQQLADYALEKVLGGWTPAP